MSSLAAIVVVQMKKKSCKLVV